MNTKCSSLTKCYDERAFVFDNSKCMFQEACAKFGDTHDIANNNGCIPKKYCG